MAALEHQLGENHKFAAWLGKFLQQWGSAIDEEVFAAYIQGMLDDPATSYTEKKDMVEEFLSAYLSADQSKSASQTIVEKYTTGVSETPDRCCNGGTSDYAPLTHPDYSEADLTTIEEQLCAMLRADSERATNQPAGAASSTVERAVTRDACTRAILREAGVAGYQGDGDEEAAVQVALADEEFRTQQRLACPTGMGSSLLEMSSTNDARNIPLDSGNQEAGSDSANADSDIDLEELEDAWGYGKKPHVKPGTVEDALVLLNPSLFGASCATTEQQQSSGSTGTSRIMIKQVTNSTAVNPLLRIPNYNLSASSSPSADQSRQNKKKKLPPPSKHVAQVGARAEAKQGRAKLNRPAVANSARARHDEMDAFLLDDFVDDSGKTDVPLPEAANNAQRVIECEREAREAAAASHWDQVAKNKQNQLQQAAAAAEHKQKAHKRAEKQEHHRR